MYTSLYGQVNWNGFTIELPEEITDAWENRTMNIVGYEFDAIRSVAGVDHPCVNNITAHSDCKTTSVPAWEQYNHHYGNSVSGTGIKMIEDPVPKLPSEWDPVEHMMGFQAGLDEGLLSFSLSNSRLYGKSTYKNKRQERMKDCPRLLPGLQVREHRAGQARRQAQGGLEHRRPADGQRRGVALHLPLLPAGLRRPGHLL